MSENLILSYSKISSFLRCRKKYYYDYVKYYELKFVNIPYVIGNCVHFGLFKIYEKDKDYVKHTIEYLDEIKKQLRKDLQMTTVIEKDLIKYEQIFRGMLNAYEEKYRSLIQDTEHITNEEEKVLEVSKGISIKIKMDNIMKYNKNKLLHEIKTTSHLNEDYVNAIQTNFQSSLYFHIYNKMHSKDPLKGIIFDVIKKPGIRIKKNESDQQFLERLRSFYKDTTNLVFYMEIIKYPIIKSKNVFNLISHVAVEINECLEDQSKFYENYASCYYKESGRGQCQFFKLCHYGENEATLSAYRVKIKKEETKNDNDKVTDRKDTGNSRFDKDKTFIVRSAKNR